MASEPMSLEALYDELAGQVHLTMGRSSYKLSQALRFMGFSLVPDTDYLKYVFETDAGHSIAYVRVHLKKLTAEHKWQLTLV